jgi:hypothetical protein
MTELIYPPCKYCGASHGMGVEEMSTSEITPMDVCYTCLWKDLKFKPILKPIELHEIGENFTKMIDLASTPIEESVPLFVKITENKLIIGLDTKESRFPKSLGKNII